MPYGDRNNAPVECHRPGWLRFVYADRADNRADRIFIRAKLPVKFERDFAKDSVPYRMVFCRVRKRDESKFRECMADLERALILEGDEGYRAFCDEFVGPVFQIARGVSGFSR